MALYRESLLFRIATSPVAMFWSGFGDIQLPGDALLNEGDIALGGGDLVNIPDFDQLINGTAERMEFTLSGVSSRTIAFAQEEAADVSGARVDIGRIDFGPDWQRLGPVEWEWNGHAVSLSVASQATEQGRQRSITLIVAAGDTRRTRSPLAFFTDADQRLRSADDAFFSHIAAINSGTSRRWGPV